MADSGQSGGTPDVAPLTEDQRKHLEFVQAVISRLATSSAAAKGWGLTVATAAFGFSATEAVPFVAGLGIVVVFLFSLLDTYYLREERLFRFLYDEARSGKVESIGGLAHGDVLFRLVVFVAWDASISTSAAQREAASASSTSMP